MFKKIVPLFSLLAFVVSACAPVTQIVGSSGSQSTPVGTAVEPTRSAGEPRPAKIDSVQIEMGTGSPIPVHAVIALSLPSACDQVAQVMQARHGSEFHLSVLTTTSTESHCLAILIPYVLKVPINTVDLPMGEYVVDVNGTRATFNVEVGPVDVIPESEATPVIREAQIDGVNIVMGVGSPIPVHIVVNGTLPDTCAQLSEIHLRRESVAGTGFQLSLMTHSVETVPGSTAMCLPDSLPFRLEFPLNIISLAEGTINVSVNGVTASFDPRTAPAPDATSDLRLVPIENVQVQVGVGSPIPVDVFVSGTWPDLCAQLAEIKQQAYGQRIEITLLATPADPNCPPDHVGLPLRIAIPLNGVELPMGTYEVVVNGVSTIFDWQKGASVPSMPLQGLAKVDHVGVDIGAGSPISVNVIVSGNFPDTCAQLGTITQQREGNDIQIALHTKSPAAGKECLQDSLPFRMNIPLNVVGLPAGTYNVTVNDASTTFGWPPQPGP